MTQKIHGQKYFQQTGISLAIHRTQVTQPIQMHTHDFTELVIVISGHGSHITATGQHHITTGDIFVIAKGEEHAYQGCREIDLYNILFDLKKLDHPINDLYQIPAYHALFALEPRTRNRPATPHHTLRLTPEDLATIQAALQTAARELDERAPGYQTIAISLFLQTAVHLARAYAVTDHPATTRLIRLGKVITHINQHLADPITLADMAEIANTSTSTLNRSFHQALQTSPIEYLIGQRLNKAKTLLTQTDTSITEIAYQTGFTDSNFFTRQFRRRHGCTPKDYRRTHTPKPTD